MADSGAAVSTLIAPAAGREAWTDGGEPVAADSGEAEPVPVSAADEARASNVVRAGISAGFMMDCKREAGPLVWECPPCEEIVT